MWKLSTLCLLILCLDAVMAAPVGSPDERTSQGDPDDKESCKTKRAMKCGLMVEEIAEAMRAGAKKDAESAECFNVRKTCSPEYDICFSGDDYSAFSMCARGTLNVTRTTVPTTTAMETTEATTTTTSMTTTAAPTTSTTTTSPTTTTTVPVTTTTTKLPPTTTTLPTTKATLPTTTTATTTTPAPTTTTTTIRPPTTTTTITPAPTTTTTVPVITTSRPVTTIAYYSASCKATIAAKGIEDIAKIINIAFQFEDYPELAWRACKFLNKEIPMETAFDFIAEHCTVQEAQRLRKKANETRARLGCDEVEGAKNIHY